ncbi:MAG: acyl-CoA thioesterase [Clostridia bacterium]|nr:acyl-CoA thioesterase [Clostridiales bacterium]MBQ6715856.1 acyl-CoA thioesterase [Clostridia bacterium]
MIMTKRWQDSYTEQVQILMPEHINGANRLFGGRLLSWIDVVAAVTARRHSGYDVTTACVDHLQFLGPAHMNDTVLLTGRITWTGRTSMEVRVDTYTETRGVRKHVNRAYLVMVAIDENETPVKVPSLLIETEEDKAEWEAAEKRKEERNRKRAEG